MAVRSIQFVIVPFKLKTINRLVFDDIDHQMTCTLVAITTASLELERLTERNDSLLFDRRFLCFNVNFVLCFCDDSIESLLEVALMRAKSEFQASSWKFRRPQSSCRGRDNLGEKSCRR